MKVLLINPVIGGKKNIIFPLGLGYIASVLIKENHEVKVLDINAHRYSKEEVERRLRQMNFNIVGLTGLLTAYSYIKWLVGKIKELRPDVKIVLGGGLGTLAPKLMIEKCKVDFVVLSEGEKVVKELIKSIEKNYSLRNVRGIAFKSENNKAIVNQPAEIIRDPDSIPFPAWHLFPMECYTGPSYLRLFNKNIKTMNMIASRGCPYNCTYCFKGAWGSKYRNRSAENIIEEIKLLKEKYGVNGIRFYDDTFILNKKMVMELCSRMIKEKLGVIWMANGRVNLMDKKLLKMMRKAGCRAICYGIESGCQRILNDMKKGVTVEQTRRTVMETWKAGILPHGYLMIGMPNDTRETINETVNLCKELSLVGRFSIVTPIPGSQLWERAKEMGRISKNLGYYLEKWSEWGDSIIVNLTTLSNKELLKLKKQAEKKIFFGNMLTKLWRHCRILRMNNILSEASIRVKEILR